MTTLDPRDPIEQHLIDRNRADTLARAATPAAPGVWTEPPLTCPHIDRAVASGELSEDVKAELAEIREINSQLRYGTWCLRAQIAASPQPALAVKGFQQRVDDWLIACFGEEIARDKIERNHRFIEEALELVQSNGCTASEAHQLVDYVFNRPVGELAQEVGGVMNTLAALCLASGIDMDAAGETELSRVWTKVEAIRAKQAAKPKHSPLPQHVASPPPSGEVEALREVIEPFAAVLDEYDPADEDDGMPGTFVAGSVTDYSLTLGDFRRARAALSCAPTTADGWREDRLPTHEEFKTAMAVIFACNGFDLSQWTDDIWPDEGLETVAKYMRQAIPAAPTATGGR